MLETPQIESAKTAVCAYRHEDIGRSGKPCDVVDFTVVRDQLRDRGRGVDIPNRTRRVYR